MAVSWTRIEQRRIWPKGPEIEARALDVMERYGRFGTDEIKRRIWNHGRFVYRNIRPKPAVAKSERAWSFRVTKAGGGGYAVMFENPATNTRGTNYPKYVHLSGVRRRLMEDVRDYTSGEFAEKMARGIGLAHLDLVKRGTVPRAITIKG